MARTPLFPRGGDFTSWALNITQRIERDYAELKEATDSISNSVSALTAQVNDISNTVSVITVQVNGISNTVSAMAVQINAVSDSVSALVVQVNAISNTVSALAVQANAISNTVSAMAVQVNSISNTVSTLAVRVSSVSATVSVIAVQVNSISNTVSVIDVRVNAISNTVSVIAAQVNAISVQANAISATVSVLAVQVNAISNTVSAIAVHIDSVSNTVSVLAVQVNSISNTVSTLAVRVSSISSTVSVIAVQVNAISNTVSALAVQANAISNTVSFLATYVVNVKSPPYNAVGDGVANDTTAVATALTAAKYKTLYIPAGTYRMEAGITLTGGVTIVGAGMGTSQLRWSTVAASRGIYLFGTAATHNEFHGIRDLSLVTGATNTGAALALNYSAQLVTVSASLILTYNRMRSRFDVENVECVGTSLLDAAGVTTGWKNGIYSTAAIQGSCRNVVVIGVAAGSVQAAAGSQGIFHAGSPASGTSENGHPVIFSHDNCNVHFCDIGIGSQNVEGMYISKCNAVACNYGYYLTAENLQPQACLMGNHANCYYFGIYIDGMSQIAVIGNLLYSIQTHTTVAIPLYILNALYGTVLGNTVVPLTPTVSAGIVVVNSTQVVVANNMVQGPYADWGIHVAGTSSGCRGNDNLVAGIAGKSVYDETGTCPLNLKTEAGVRQAFVSAPGGQLVTVSFSSSFDNVIKSVVANPMNADGVVGGDDWLAINSYSLGGFVLRYNTGSSTSTRSFHFMAYGY